MENLPNPVSTIESDDPIAVLQEKARAACDGLAWLLSGSQREILESIYAASEEGDHTNIKLILDVSLAPLDQKVLVIHHIVEPSERQRGLDRMTHKIGIGQKKPRTRTQDIMGKILNMSGKTYTRAVWVVETAATLKHTHPDAAKRAIGLLNEKSVRAANLYLLDFLAVANLPNPSHEEKTEE